jgi:hypothetical protein
MTDTTTADAGTETGQQDTQQKTGQQQEATFTQADVDKAIRDRLARERTKYADYDELKAKAEGAKTLEEKLADLQKRTDEADARALRSDIAAKHGISPEDRDLFLTGADEATLEAQAKRLSDRDAATKTQGNVARSEGTTKTTGSDKDGEMRDFAHSFFGSGD